MKATSAIDGVDAITPSSEKKPASRWAHLTVNVDFDDGGESTTNPLEIRKPFSQRFFTIHQSWEIPSVPILMDEKDRGQVYVLAEEVSKALPPADRKYASIYAATTSDDILFFHFRRETGNEQNIWARTARDVVALGRAGWIRVTPAPSGGYAIHHPTDPTFTAKRPAWPDDIDAAFDQALNGVTGEGGQLIASVKHRVIASLVGKK